MTRRNYVFWSVIVIIFAAVLNVVIVDLMYGNDEYIQTADIVGNEYLEKRNTVRYADNKLKEYEYDDYGEAAEAFSAEKISLEKYRVALKYRDEGIDPMMIYNDSFHTGKPFYEWTEEILSEYDLTDEQAAARIEQLEYCAKRLKYAANYPKYIGYVSENSSSLLAIPLLDRNSYAAQNAAKTMRDFYGLENVKPAAESDLGIICMFSDRMTDFISIACAIMLAVLFTQYRKKSTFSGNGGIFASCLTACVGAALIYLCGGAVINNSVGLGDLSRPVQSVSTFLTCSSVMSVGNLALLRIFFKLTVFAAIYFISVGIMMSPKRKIGVIIAAVAAAGEIIMYNSGGAVRPVSILSALSSEEIFAVYGNIDFFGNAVHPQLFFLPAAAVTVIVSSIYAWRSAAAFGLAARENAERAYYDKISSTYDETRKIRHDISNHLSALAVLLDSDNVTEARRYLSDISSEIKAQSLPVSTGRAVLDALLYSKCAAAEKEGIKLAMEFKSDIGEKYTDFDLCGIFGNILDNAIEGCRKAKGEKEISLTVKRQLDMLCIFCENNCAPIKNADMSTDKSDKTAHGFGLKRIGQLAEKYGGGVEISVENGVFSISVII